MPVLSNPRHERFCQALATGSAPTKAYVIAGYSKKSAPGSAVRLRKNAAVCERIAELTQQVADKSVERAVIDREWVLASLRQNCSLAMALGEDGKPAPTFNGNVANRALELLGKEVGLFRDIQDRRVTVVDPSKMTEQQLRDWIAFLEPIAAQDDPGQSLQPQQIEAPGDVIDIQPAQQEDEVPASAEIPA